MEKKETLRKFKFFMVWQEKKEEKWLEMMAGNGWHLTKVRPFVYYFIKGVPQDMVYQFDFKGTPNEDWDDYLRIYKDAGWEHVTTMGGWIFFRRPKVVGESQEIFTDKVSLIEKYRRVLRLLVLSIAPAPILLAVSFLLL